MSIKSEKVQKYISEIGSKSQKYLLLGTGRSTIASNDSNSSSINLWKDSQITYRIGKNDVVGVVPNVTWRQSVVYTPWSSSTINTGSFYAYNKTNGVVYLCLSDNEKNRKDLRGQSVSAITPTHTIGVQRYSDGYEWLALYKITPSLLRFVSTSWMPVISLNDFEFDTATTKYSESLSFCTGETGACGNCAVYFKENSEIPASITTNDVYYKGDLFSTISNTTCAECFHMFYGDDNFVSKFYGSETPDSTITIKDKLDEIGEYVTTNQLAPSSPYYQLYQMAINSPEDGALLSCFIDLSQFSETQLTATQANPELNILTATGTGARIRLTTYINRAGSHVVNGIQLLERGSNYYDAQLSLSASIMPSVDIDLFLSAIELNFDRIDSIGVDPISTLECKHVSTDIRLSTDDLTNSNITIPDQINFYGFVDNPLLKTSDGDIVPAGRNISKFQSSVQTNNTKIKIKKVAGSAPTLGEEVSLVNNTNTLNLMTNLNVISTSNETGSEIVLELNGVDNTALTNFDLDDGLISINNGEDEYEVVEYTSIPPIVQYSGKITLTKKIETQNLTSQSGEVSKIIRINRIEAL